MSTSKTNPKTEPSRVDPVSYPVTSGITSSGHHSLGELLDCLSCGPDARGELAKEARERLNEEESFSVAVAKHPALKAGVGVEVRQ